LARVKAMIQFYLPPARLSTSGMNHPAFILYAFTGWHHQSKVAHIPLQLSTHFYRPWKNERLSWL